MKAVLYSLNINLKKVLGRDPLVFVLSIVGTQSTGKSTLLNTMFGCRLKVSAGQCTRGINLQLVKAENRGKIFDYILVIDTEGIRSPEFFGTDKAVWRDNRLATFSILPADACIITTVNEEDSAIKEVLPIVMLAFRGSSIAEKISGHLRPIMFFVYSRVDTSKQALEKFDNNRRKLLLELQEAAIRIKGLGAAEDGTEAEHESSGTDKDVQNTASHIGSTNQLLREFSDREGEEDSDVKYLGLLNRGDQAPDDIPNFEFGEKVIKLREYIYRRLSENGLKGERLSQWCQYLETVTQCIDSTDFELNFKTCMEYQAYSQLKTKLEAAKQKVCRYYSKQYKIFEETITCYGDSFSDTPPSIKQLEDNFHNESQSVVNEQSKYVRELLKETIFKKYETQEWSKWELSLMQTKAFYSHLLKDCFQAQFEFKKQLEKYEENIVLNLRKYYEENSQGIQTEELQTNAFEVIFKKQHDQAIKNHPAVDVVGAIDAEYAQWLSQFDISRAFLETIRFKPG